MGKEILNRSIPRMKVGKGSMYDGNHTYGRIAINDLALTDFIGKDVEIDVIVREYDANKIKTEAK